jgi:hypothetical protein
MTIISLVFIYYIISSLYNEVVIIINLATILTLGPTVPLSKTHANRPSWRRQARNLAAEPT